MPNANIIIKPSRSSTGFCLSGSINAKRMSRGGRKIKFIILIYSVHEEMTLICKNVCDPSYSVEVKTLYISGF